MEKRREKERVKDKSGHEWSFGNEKNERTRAERRKGHETLLM